MNDFFKRKRLLFCFIVLGLLIIYTVFSFLNLAIQPISSKAKKAASVERGSIVDKNGVPLAVQTVFYRIGVNTKDISDKRSFAKNMCASLEMSEDSLFEKIDKKREYVILKKKASMAEYDQISSLAYDFGYTNINYEKLPGRIYPNNSMASQLIGYMGDEGVGLAGIEFSQQNVLSPPVTSSSETVEQGKNVYLTIDTTLQYKLEQISYSAMQETQAESMMMIAADSQTGEILSYISLPSANLNDYGMADNQARLNRPSTNAYEPGSVFKIFTVGIVRDEGGISASDSFLCDGGYEKRLNNGETVKIKCLDHHGWLTPREALKFSCNDVLGQISDRISEERFIERICELGFGEKTGIELSGETTGFVKRPNNKTWSVRSKPTIAIGQEISVSALQMVQAATAIANGGNLVKLKVISKITDKEGNVIYQHVPEIKENVFHKDTANYVLSCMETTATTGTGSRANIGDVAIGVKTGTAQMADKENGGYSDTDFLSNCIAIFPVDDPQIILYIVIEKAKGETYAGRIVAPVIAQAADVIIDHLGISRGKASSLAHNGIISIPRSSSVKLGSLMPDFTGYSKKELLPLTSLKEVKININGSGWVTSQSPEPGTPISQGTIIELYLE